MSCQIPPKCLRHARARWSSSCLQRSQSRQPSQLLQLPLRPLNSQCRHPLQYQPAARAFSTSSRHNASILSALSDNKGAYNKRIRRGRGPGSGKGKTSGRGHGGQKSRGKPPPNFGGGQTPVWLLKPARGRGVKNPRRVDMVELNLDRLQSWVDQGRLNPHRPITIYELHKSGCTSTVHDGVKLLSRGSEHLKTPLHIIVSRASESAIEAIEAAGGSVTTRFYSKFAIQKVLRGESDPINSRLFVPTPITRLAASEGKQFKYALPDPVRRRDLEYYRDVAKRGYLSYMVPEGHTPSLLFRTPGSTASSRMITSLKSIEEFGKKETSGKSNRLW